MATGLFTWAKLLASLYEFYDTASDSLDWLTWSQEATGNVAIGQAPPPSPQSPAKFQEALERARKRIDELPTPTFNARLPDSGVVPTTGFDATREAIRLRISDLLACVSEISDARSAIDYFATLEIALNNQISMLYTLAQEMWKLAETYPVEILIETLAFQAIDVEYSYIPFVAGTLDKLKAKRDVATAAVTARLSEVRAAANEIRNVLTVEAIDLRAAVERLEQLDAEVQKLQEAVVKAIEARDKAAADVQRQQVLRDAAEMDVAETEERLSSAQAAVTGLRNRIQQVIAELNVQYDCPISHVPWDECTSAEHVQYKNAYAENQKRLRDDLTQLQASLTSAQDSVVAASNDLTAAKNTLVNYEGRLRNAKVQLETCETRLKQAQELWKDKARFAQEEKQRLRADIFASENKSDQTQVQDLVAQLGATP